MFFPEGYNHSLLVGLQLHSHFHNYVLNWVTLIGRYDLSSHSCTSGRCTECDEPRLAATVGSPSRQEFQTGTSDVLTMLTQMTAIICSELCPFSTVVTASGFAQG